VNAGGTDSLGSTLVTGATGFIGSRLLERLASDGVEVHAVHRAGVPPTCGSVHWHAAGSLSESALADIVERARPEVVFHLAGRASGSRGLEEVARSFDANLATTVALLAAVARNGKARVILAGSLEEPDEADEMEDPTSPYAVSKWAARVYGRLFRSLYGVPVIHARIFMVYGPHNRDRKKLIPYLIDSLRAGRAPLLRGGSRAVDWIHVDDVVEGLVRIGGRPELDGCSIELGTGQLHTVREVADGVRRLLGSSVVLEFGALPERPRETIRRADLQLTERLLGWSPSIDLEEGLRRTVAAEESGRV
jgi:UDP-glucose 4-epimerase